MCFALIPEQTAIIYLYSIDCLVFITEKECVYCAVRTGYLNTTDNISSVKDEHIQPTELQVPRYRL